ncbi:RNA polymerase sigma factor [Pseudoflavonifractor sp.]|uniref:RNA polymerase sigma factor n=1 Tax=Pseudoflavonifractor sp. TaxID=1980281 RepID=UPI003D927389
MDEQQLQAAFSAGDEAALSAAIDRYGQSLLRYCHHILCDYHEAQDVVQDTFFKAWRYRERLKAAPLQPWLYRLAYTACIDQIRRRKRQLFPPPPQTPSDPDYIGEDLRRALLTLKPEERALVFGRVMEEESFEVLAQRQGVSAATARQRYLRSKKKLAKALAPSHPSHAKEDCL